MSLADFLQQFQGEAIPNTEQHFDQAVSMASADQMSRALTDTFRSEQTPAFSQMVGQMFGRANPTQRAGMLNQVRASLGPIAL